jgi:hypothetical protein
MIQGHLCVSAGRSRRRVRARCGVPTPPARSHAYTIPRQQAPVGQAGICAYTRIGGGPRRTWHTSGLSRSALTLIYDWARKRATDSRRPLNYRYRRDPARVRAWASAQRRVPTCAPGCARQRLWAGGWAPLRFERPCSLQRGASGHCRGAAGVALCLGAAAWYCASYGEAPLGC